MPDGKGVPLPGDRSAWDNVNFPERHAKDINDAAPVNHVPSGIDSGDVPTWDGNKWVPAQPAAVPSAFLDLTDTPDDYTGFGEKLVAVKSDETGLEFIDAPTGGGAGTVTKKLIQTKTVLYDDVLGSDEAGWDVQGISQDYDDLELTIFGRTADAGTLGSPVIRFNNDGNGNNYAYQYRFQAPNVGGGTGDGAADAGTQNGWLPGGGSSASVFGHIILHLPGYSSDKKKVHYGEAFLYVTSGMAVIRSQNLWKSTDGINRITVTNSADYLAGSRIQILGIKNIDVVTDVSGLSDVSWEHNPDVPPVEPDDMDDEFSGDTLDEKWTIQNQQGLNIEVANGLIHLYCASQGTHRYMGIEQPTPAGSWKFRCKVNKNFGYRAYCAIALEVRDSGTDKFRSMAVMDHSSYGPGVCIFQYSDSGLDTLVGETNLANNIYALKYYFEIEHTIDNVVHWRVSSDGFNFDEVASASDASYVTNPDRIGLVVEAYGTGIDYTVDWFRRIS